MYIQTEKIHAETTPFEILRSYCSISQISSYIQSIRIAVQIPPTIAAIYHDHKTSQL